MYVVSVLERHFHLSPGYRTHHGSRKPIRYVKNACNLTDEVRTTWRITEGRIPIGKKETNAAKERAPA